MTGSWLLWEPKSDKMIQSASVIFPQFQSLGGPKTGNSKGSLSNIVHRAALGSVSMERYFHIENTAIEMLPLTKDITIPEHLGQALSGRYQDHWRAAFKCELNQILAWDVLEEVPKTGEMKTIGHHWVFDIKQQASGGIEKFKAWLVARGDRQQPGIDCTEAYAPTTSLMSLHLILAYTVCSRWPMASFDVSGAYLYSPVQQTVFVEPHLKGKALRVKKALYGMKQAGRCWWIFLSDILTQMGFTAMEVDQSLYIFGSSETTVAIWIHFDDGVVMSNSQVDILNFMKHLCDEVEIKWHDTITQIAYPQTIIKTDLPLPALPASNSNSKDATPFCLVIGSLAYLVSGSHPDLAFVVHYLARHSMSPMGKHWGILHHVMGYLLKMQSHRLMLQPDNISLNLWSDAGWGGNLEHSQLGFMLKLGDAPILWTSKWQGVVALSTCAAEYVALSDSTQHFVQAINQLSQLVKDFNKEIFCNNQAAVQVSIDNHSRK
ncbi:hypothetical protein O181_114732 [Austropuccinia psidii MF-1]|uniref:Reverse transcriptase Ty1/copia-type domain-containing protein n=1 Tax=Austropuccinia psidii MF-1 TaxID=1389203 RepID=A0A9Q3PWN2_9BASI|nr:hypothetical protein [Austropuccinia psidii MF-1]